jgi:hypothetical protein
MKKVFVFISALMMSTSMFADGVKVSVFTRNYRKPNTIFKQFTKVLDTNSNSENIVTLPTEKKITISHNGQQFVVDYDSIRTEGNSIFYYKDNLKVLMKSYENNKLSTVTFDDYSYWKAIADAGHKNLANN